MTNGVPVDGADRSDAGYNYKESVGSTAGSNSLSVFFFFDVVHGVLNTAVCTLEHMLQDYTPFVFVN